MKKKHSLSVVVLFLLSFPAVVYGASIGQTVGIASSPNPVGSGARALGMGGAFIAVADDATAASWNPAGLIQLENPETSIVGAYDSRSEEISSATNPESNTNSNIEEFNLNYFSASIPFNLFNKNMVASLNYQHLYSFKRQFNYRLRISEPPPIDIENVQDRTYDQDGSLSALGLAYAIEMTPHISLGLTLNIWTSQLCWDNGWDAKYTNQSMTTSGATVFSQDTRINEEYSNLEGLNLNLGFLWNVNRSMTIGAVLKTPFSAKFDHQYNYEWVRRDGGGNITGSGNLSVSDEIELWMPMSYGLGFAWRYSDHFTMDLDVYRTHWSDYILTDGEGNQMSPINALPKDQSDIQDTTQVRLGAEYLFYKPESKWIIPLRGGLFYDPEPAQSKVNDFYGVSIGSGVGYKQYFFDAAYQFRWGQDVDTSNIIGSSTADILQHTILFSFILHF
ncbi:OmpP1/FadL family transporter [Thermodesulfobacteriota bacterium]